MSEQLQIIPEKKTLPDIKSITTLVSTNVPLLEKARDGAKAMMAELTEITNEDDREDAANIVIAVRTTYDRAVALRKAITGPMDEMKKYLMEYEKPLSDDKDSDYSKFRAMIAAYDQIKIDEKKKVEEVAAKKKLRENHLVDIGTQVLQNLNKLILTKTKEADSKSKTFFDNLTLGKFDEGAETYRKMKPNLKPEEYNFCFSVPYDTTIFDRVEALGIIETLKEVETFNKWNEEVIKACSPIINEWRAKIPQLKENLIKLINESDESERAKLKAEQDRQAQAEADRRARELEQQTLAKSMDIASNADLSKLENEFVEQATSQQAGETGPVKLVLKFTDKKQIMKAFSTIVYHCMTHKDFPGIYKKNNEGEHIEAVQWWVDFFLKKCDADIMGTEVREEAKLIIRK